MYQAEIQVVQGSQGGLWLLEVLGNLDHQVDRWNQESLDLRVILCLLFVQWVLEIQVLQESLVGLEK